MRGGETAGARGDELGHSRACSLEDFRHPHLLALINDVFPGDRRLFGPTFPRGREYRKYWEVAMAIRALDAGGAVRRDADVLGVAAGTEATLFWLTTRVRRVFATDLYLEPGGWGHTARTGMLDDPATFAPCPFEPRRLVVQHMDALELSYEDGTFDGVFSSSSIEHFGGHPEVRRAVAEMHRVLRPGGVLSLSTELRLAGPAPGLPGTLLFDRAALEACVLEGLDWEWLGPPLDVEVSPATLAAPVPFAEAVADIRAGRREWSRYPHLVLEEGAHRWTSVHLALRRPGAAGRS